MGNKFSKNKDHKKLLNSQGDSTGIEADSSFTFYDQFGILRKGVATEDGLVHDRDQELERILQLEDTSKFTPEEKAVWYIVESGWIRTWLSYVRFGTSSLGKSLSSPAPGPINNEALLIMTADEEGTAALPEGELPLFKWVPREGLMPAGKGSQGHYRRVNYKVWEAFCQMYPGCGPEIKVDMMEIKEKERLKAEEEEAALKKKQEEELAKRTGKKPKPKVEEEDDEEGNPDENAPPQNAPPAEPDLLKAPSADGAKGPDGEEEEKKGDEDDEEEDEEEDSALDVNNTAWQDIEHWHIDQSQDRFRAKFSEKYYPKKSETYRNQQLKDLWNRKKLRRQQKEEEEKEKEEEEAKNAAEQGEGVEETKSDEPAQPEPTEETKEDKDLIDMDGQDEGTVSDDYSRSRQSLQPSLGSVFQSEKDDHSYGGGFNPLSTHAEE